MQKSLSTYIVIFAYVPSQADKYAELSVILSQHYFSHITADPYGIPRELPASTYAYTCFQDIDFVDGFVRSLLLSVADFRPEIRILPLDAYYSYHRQYR